MSAPATDPVWLTLIGLGEDGLDGLSPAASRALELSPQFTEAAALLQQLRQ
jgi:precorrin-6B methylase 1